MSLIDLALLPIRVGLEVVDAVLQAATPASPAPPSELLVVDGMPEGVPAAALRPEPALPAPAGWPFGEEFPRTCGTSRFAGGALFWTDFLYDDHGATGVPVDIPTGGLVPPRGTYVYPAGPAARNGADIFRVAVGLTDTHTWWRVDWNRCWARPSRSRCSRSTPTAAKHPPTNGPRAPASAPPASTWHCSSRLRARG